MSSNNLCALCFTQKLSVLGGDSDDGADQEEEYDEGKFLFG